MFPAYQAQEARAATASAQQQRSARLSAAEPDQCKPPFDSPRMVARRTPRPTEERRDSTVSPCGRTSRSSRPCVRNVTRMAGHDGSFGDAASNGTDVLWTEHSSSDHLWRVSRENIGSGNVTTVDSGINRRRGMLSQNSRKPRRGWRPGCLQRPRPATGLSAGGDRSGPPGIVRRHPRNLPQR